MRFARIEEDKVLWLVTTANVATILSVLFLSQLPVVRWLLGIVYVLFLPGYSLTQLLFTPEEINATERVAYTFGLSAIAVILLSYLLDYLTLGIRLIPVLLGLAMFSMSCILLAKIKKALVSSEQKSSSSHVNHHTNRTIIILTVSILTAIFFLMAAVNSFWPWGWDTFFHIKYTRFIIGNGTIPLRNPYFPQFSHAYTPGAHALTAVVSLITGLDAISLYSVLPAIFLTPVFIAFYVLAKTYLEERFAYWATLLFIFASLWHGTIYATNGAPLGNSIAFPYASMLVAFTLLPLFLLSFLKVLERFSINYFVACSLMLGGIMFSYHIMAVVAIGVLLTYLLLTVVVNELKKRGGSKGIFKLVLGILICGAVVSSPYLFHLFVSGIPKETGALDTYAALSVSNYIELLKPPLFVLFPFSIVLITRFSQEEFRKHILLISWAFFLLASAESYKIGIYLVNDRFAWYLISPASIIVAIGISKIFAFIEQNYTHKVSRHALQKIFKIILLFLTWSAFPLQSVFPYKPGLPREVVPNAVKWLLENAGRNVVATSPSTGFVISSLSDISVIAIPKIMADYYIEDLSERIEDVRKIFGGLSPQLNVSDSLASLGKYNVKYLYIDRVTEDWLPNRHWTRLLGTTYFEQVYPKQQFFKETVRLQDIDGDGVLDSFREIAPSGLYDSYIYTLTMNDTTTDTLTLRAYSPPATSGSVSIFINGFLIANVTGSTIVEGRWRIYEFQVPKEVLKDTNKVFIQNGDLFNPFFIDYIGMGATPTNINVYSYDAVIYEFHSLA